MDHRYGLLAINAKASLIKLVSHNRLVNRFEQSRTIGAVNLESNVNNLFCYFVFSHGRFKFISRKGAKTQRNAKKKSKRSADFYLKIPATATAAAFLKNQFAAYSQSMCF